MHMFQLPGVLYVPVQDFSPVSGWPKSLWTPLWGGWELWEENGSLYSFWSIIYILILKSNSTLHSFICLNWALEIKMQTTVWRKLLKLASGSNNWHWWGFLQKLVICNGWVWVARALSDEKFSQVTISATRICKKLNLKYVWKISCFRFWSQFSLHKDLLSSGGRCE